MTTRVDLPHFRQFRGMQSKKDVIVVFADHFLKNVRKFEPENPNISDYRYIYQKKPIGMTALEFGHEIRLSLQVS